MMILLILYLSLSPLTRGCGYDDPDYPKSKQWKKINDYIRSLKYDQQEVLTYRGTPPSGKKNYTQTFDDELNYRIESSESKPLENIEFNFGLMGSHKANIFPGALVLGNQHFLENTPDIVQFARRPMTYMVDLQMNERSVFTTLPTASQYKIQHDKAVTHWYNKYAQSSSVSSQYMSDYSFAWSKEQLRVRFGMEFANSAVEANIDFEAISKRQKLAVVYRFRQIFYSVEIERPCDPADIFGQNVTYSDVMSRINRQNPPLMVDKISYGRLFYVVMDTESTDREAKGMLDGKLNVWLNGNFSVNVSDYKSLQNLHIKVFAYGGSAQSVTLVSVKSVEEIYDVVIKNPNLGRDNPAVPLFYSTIFLKDFHEAKVSSYTSYMDSEVASHVGGKIEICQNSARAAWYMLTWDEETIENGLLMLKPQEVKGYVWSNQFADKCKSHILKGNSKNVKLEIQVNYDLTLWKTYAMYDNLPLIKHRTFTVMDASGIIFKDYYVTANPEVPRQ